MARGRHNKGLTRAQERHVLAELRAERKTVAALLAAIDVVAPDLKQELVWAILYGISYDRIEFLQGRVPINRADFYGLRRKTLAIYAQLITGGGTSQ